MARQPSTPRTRYIDGVGVGHLAEQWGRSPEFVHALIEQGQLNVNERGVITNDELQRFYREHTNPTDTAS